MTNLKPQVDPAGYYNISETARALGVERHTVTRYAAQGLITFRVRRAGRRRVTSGAQIIRCWEKFY